MPSDNDAKGVTFPSGKEKKEKEKKEKKHGRSIGWIIGVVVLILISVTFVLPTTVFSTNNGQKIVFGSYNGEEIAFIPSYDNYFYNQLSALAQSYGLTQQNAMQVYSQAFYSTVLKTALSQMAETAGITATDRTISDALISSGAFNDENGRFDRSLYDNASAMQIEAMRNNLRDTLPAQTVLSDMLSIKTSDAENEFVSALNDTYRSFDYILVDYNAYPDADAAAYAVTDPAPFMTMDLSVITVATETAVNDISAALASGDTTFEEAVSANSTDAYKSDNGNMGAVLYHNLESMLMNSEDAATVFSTAQGEYAAPVQGYSGWMIFRADSASREADTTDEAVLADIKRYISINDAETMNAYLETASESAYANAQSDFEKAAEDLGTEVIHVGASAYNPSSSSFIIGLNANDGRGMLASAAVADEAFHEELFTAEDGTVLAPHMVGSSYVIARPVASDETNELLASYMDSFYTSYAPELAAQDLQTTVFESENFENNFFTVFLNDIMNIGNN